MVQCRHCLREMKTADGCDPAPFRFVGEGKDYQQVKYGEEADDWGAGSGRRCHDCGCLPGNYHHIGCDVERCPRCGGQAIGCDCDPEIAGHG
jgi:hypothetical protein